MDRWRGLKALVVDAVENGSRAVQVPVKGIREIHDTAVAGVHGMIRLVNRVTGQTLDLVLDAVEHHRAQPPPEG